MTFTKNKKYQYLFFGILSVYTIFNGGNSNLFIQLNFILFGFLFIYCLRDKNYRLHLSNFINNNKISIFFYSLFIIYLFFQIIPIPVEMLKFISHEKYKFINILSNEISYTSISFHPSDSYFQTLNFITIFIVVLIFKMIFYTDRHINRLFIYLSFLGFISSLFAVILFLYGNPDFLIFKNPPRPPFFPRPFHMKDKPLTQNSGRSQAELADRVIRAPFSGHIGLTDIDPGDRVSDATPIAQIAGSTLTFPPPRKCSRRCVKGRSCRWRPFPIRTIRSTRASCRPIPASPATAAISSFARQSPIRATVSVPA